MTAKLDYEGAETVEIDGVSDDITELEDSIEAELDNIFSEVGSDKQDVTFKIRVDKVLEGKGEMAYCFSCLPSELPIMDRIRDGYGSGKYQIRVWKTVPGKGARLIKKPMVNIMAGKKPPARVADNSGDLAGVLAAMAEANRQQMEQFKELMLMNRPQVAPPPQQSLTELVTALAGLQGLMPQPAPGNDMAMFLKGVEMMKDYGGGGGEKGFADVLITAAKEFGGPIMEMSKTLSNMPAPGGQAPPGGQPAPVGQPMPQAVAPPGAQITYPSQPSQPPAQTAPVESTPENEQMFMLKMQVQNLVGKAKSGASPALYADLILDNMSDEQITQFLGQENLKESLVSLVPEVAEHWTWFEELQREVMAGMSSDNLTDEESESHTIGDAIPETGPEPDAIEPPAPGDTPANT